jgi:hypothetical protein
MEEFDPLKEYSVPLKEKSLEKLNVKEETSSFANTLSELSTLYPPTSSPVKDTNKPALNHTDNEWSWSRVSNSSDPSSISTSSFVNSRYPAPPHR